MPKLKRTNRLKGSNGTMITFVKPQLLVQPIDANKEAPGGKPAIQPKHASSSEKLLVPILVAVLTLTLGSVWRSIAKETIQPAKVQGCLNRWTGIIPSACSM
jgi:hypothetical protein